MFKSLALLGDIHGDTTFLERAVNAIDDETLLVQIGDFGFAKSYQKLNKLDSRNVKVLGGNHDEYPALVNYPHYLGDFGLLPNCPLKVGYLRGAYSIDREYRKEGKDWWPEEELTHARLVEFLEWWIEEKPEILISHCSSEKGLYYVVNTVYGASRTETMIDNALAYHQPKYHFHGHLHVAKNYQLFDIKCRSLGINELVEIRF